MGIFVISLTYHLLLPSPLFLPPFRRPPRPPHRFFSYQLFFSSPPLLHMAVIGSAKRLRTSPEPEREPANPFTSLTDDLIFRILDRLDSDPLSRKSLSSVSRSFLSLESRHRCSLTPLRSPLLPAALARYPSLSRVDLTLCPSLTDGDLTLISSALRSTLRSIDLSKSKNFSFKGLESIVSNCESLVEIDLSNRADFGDREAVVMGKARNLERLGMGRWSRLTDLGVGCVAVGCGRLKLLGLKGCVNVTDLGVGLVAVKCPELRSLDVSYLPVTKKCLPAILQLQYLEELSLAGCNGFDDGGFLTLRQGFKSLEVLNMSDCQYASQAGLTSILNGATGLRQLILAYYSPVTPSLASSLQKLSKLHSIKLDGCHVTASGLKSIGSFCISLKELSLSKCSGVTDDGLSFVAEKHRDLVKLDITCCRMITDVSLARITSSCTSLTSLRMESCTQVSWNGFVLIGQHCHLLEELDITDNDLHNEGLKAISGCQKLTSLKVGISLHISDEGLIPVGNCCSKLQELDLYRSVGVTNVGVAAVACGCPMLQMINLAYCTEVTDDALISLSKCSMLNTLEIRGCPQVSSAGLSAIAVGCRKIVKLDIKKCFNINDAGMLPLACLSQNLRQINLSYCSMTDVGLLALSNISCLQNMTMLHVKGVTPNGLAAALLAYSGLTKVKLHSSFKSLISKPLLDHLESRGCMLQWRDKPFQVEVDSVEIWKQRSQEILVV